MTVVYRILTNALYLVFLSGLFEAGGFLYFGVLKASVSGYVPGAFMEDTTLAWRTEYSSWGAWHVPNASARAVGRCFDVVYRSNSYGARDREHSRYGTDRILLLGDSFVEGFGVSEHERLGNLLEKSLGRPVLNFSSALYFGPLQYEILYRDLAREFEHTDLVVTLLPRNDFTDNDQTYWQQYLDPQMKRYRPYYSADGDVRYFSDPQPGLTVAQLLAPVSEGRFLRDLVHRYSWTYGFFAEYRALRASGAQAPSYSGYRDFSPEQLKHVLGSLQRIAAMAKDRGVRVHLLVIASRSDYDIRADEDRLSPELSAFAREHKLSLLDLRTTMPFTPDLFLDCDGHWSARGNAAAAALVAPLLNPARTVTPGAIQR